MPETTNEAPAPEVVEVYPDEETQALAEAQARRVAEMQRDEAGDEPEAAEPPKDDAQPEDTQAEEVTASGESSGAEAEAEAPADDPEPDLDLKGLPDEWKDRLLKAHKAGAMSVEELAETKEHVLKGMGFDKKMRDLAEKSKALEAQAERGAQFDALFADDAERDTFLAWREQQAKASEPEPTPSFDTDEDLIKYVRDMVDKGVEERLSAAREQELREAESARAAGERLVGALETHYSSLDGVTEDEYREACESLNTEIRADGQLPWEVLKDADVVARKIQPHLERLTLQKRLDALEDQLKVTKNEHSKSEAARSAEVSSPIGRSTRTEHEYPDTPEGRAARTLAQLEGRTPRDF